MLQLTSGQYFGRTTGTVHVEGLTLTDTEYLHDRVDWHYHERPYFTFLLQGGLVEGTRKAVHHCAPGALLFHNWQEPHYNIKPRGRSRGFHVELDAAWLTSHDQDLSDLEGDLRLHDPDIKFLFHRIHFEAGLQGKECDLSVSSLLLQVLDRLRTDHTRRSEGRPAWVDIVRDRLHDLEADVPSLGELSRMAGVHPVHLSRSFPRYFQDTLGGYIRKLRVDHALALMADREHSLTFIAHAAGFSDQSHFIRCFRDRMGMAPSSYRRLRFS